MSSPAFGLRDIDVLQLLAAIIQVYDVKVTGAKLNDVAVLMGSGKSHRGFRSSDHEAAPKIMERRLED